MLKTSYISLVTRPEVMPTIGLALVASRALDAYGFDHTQHLGDGHITLVYGHLPGVGLGTFYAGVRPKYPVSVEHWSFLSDGSEPMRITAVERGFDGRTLIAKLDSPRISREMAELYNDKAFCRGHPEYAGLWKLDDPLWGRRALHLTLARGLDLARMEAVPAELQAALVGMEVRACMLQERVKFADDRGVEHTFVVHRPTR